jgi:hypothetical protein
MNIIIKTHLLLFLFCINSFAQLDSSGDAQGVFFTVGVGPRFPIGDLGSEQTIGAGFDAMVSVTDNNIAPLFFYVNVGYQNHPGDYDFYKISEHSSITTNIISFHAGSKYFFEPIINDMFLLMPILEGGLSYAYVEKYHQYKIDSNKKDNLQGISKFGFHFGGGISFFLMDLVAIYNYFPGEQYFSLNVRLTIPVGITI